MNGLEKAIDKIFSYNLEVKKKERVLVVVDKNLKSPLLK